MRLLRQGILHTHLVGPGAGGSVRVVAARRRGLQQGAWGFRAVRFSVLCSVSWHVSLRGYGYTQDREGLSITWNIMCV